MAVREGLAPSSYRLTIGDFTVKLPDIGGGSGLGDHTPQGKNLLLLTRMSYTSKFATIGGFDGCCPRFLHLDKMMAMLFAFEAMVSRTGIQPVSLP